MAKLYNFLKKDFEDVADEEVPKVVSAGTHAFEGGSQVPVISPDGQRGFLPAENFAKALSEGYQFETPELGKQTQLKADYRDSPLLAGAAGAARGLTLGGSDALGAAVGIGEDLNALQKFNPGASTTGEVLGGLGSLAIPGGGLVGAVSKLGKAAEAGIASRIATEGLVKRALSKSMGSAAEGAVYGAGQTVSEAALGDPEKAAENLLANVGISALLGGGLTLGFEGGTAMMKAGVQAIPNPKEMIRKAETGLLNIFGRAGAADDFNKLLDDPNLREAMDGSFIAQLESLKAEAKAGIGGVNQSAAQAEAELRRMIEDVPRDSKLLAKQMLSQASEASKALKQQFAETKEVLKSELRTSKKVDKELLVESGENISQRMFLANEAVEQRKETLSKELNTLLDSDTSQVTGIGAKALSLVEDLQEILIGSGKKVTNKSISDLKFSRTEASNALANGFERDVMPLFESTLHKLDNLGLRESTDFSERLALLQSRGLTGGAEAKLVQDVRRAIGERIKPLFKQADSLPIQEKNAYEAAKKVYDELNILLRKETDPKLGKALLDHDAEIKKLSDVSDVFKEFTQKRQTAFTEKGKLVKNSKDSVNKTVNSLLDPEKVPVLNQVLDNISNFYDDAIAIKDDLAKLPGKAIPSQATEKLKEEALKPFKLDPSIKQQAKETRTLDDKAFSLSEKVRDFYAPGQQPDVTEIQSFLGELGVTADLSKLEKLKGLQGEFAQNPAMTPIDKYVRILEAMGDPENKLEAVKKAAALQQTSDRLGRLSYSGGGPSLGAGALPGILGGAAIGGPLGAAVGLGVQAIQNPVSLLKAMTILGLDRANGEFQRKLMDGVSGAFDTLSKLGINSSIKGSIERKTLHDFNFGDYEEKKGSKLTPESFEKKVSSLTRLASDPEALADRVSERMRLSTEAAPALTTAAIMQAQKGIAFLQSKAPVTQELQMFPGQKTMASKSEIAKFERYVRAVEEPLSVIEDLKEGRMSPEAVEALKAVYPQMFAQIQQSVLQRIADNKQPVSQQAKLQLGLLLGIPTTPSLTPDSIMRSQALYAPSQPQGQQQGAGSPKAIAGISESRQTSIDKSLGSLGV